MQVRGTQSKKLLGYIDRACEYLGLYDVDAYIELEFVKRCDGNVAGYCHGDDYTIMIEVARNDACGRVPQDLLMINIAHELIHAKQIATGTLADDGFTKRKLPKWIWKGTPLQEVNYQDMPWEKEAYKLENIVYDACKEDKK